MDGSNEEMQRHFFNKREKILKGVVNFSVIIALA